MMNNKDIITYLFKTNNATIDEVLEYVKKNKISETDYKEITGEDCPEISINIVKTNKCADIELSCKQAIYSGFKSSVKDNTEKLYGTTAEDQMNISGNALTATSKIAGVEGCQNDKFYYHASGEEFTEWTAEEVLQLARDFKAFKEANLVKSKQLQEYVNTLTDTETIKSINWDTDLSTITDTTETTTNETTTA